MLILGQGLESMPLDQRQQIIMGHSGLGTLVLLLMIVRWSWRLSHKPPGPTSTMGTWQTRLSKWTHWSLYLLLIFQPVFGILQAMHITDYEIVAFGLINYSGMVADNAERARLFHILHGLNASIITVLVIGHVLASFYHHFVQKDDVLQRMLPFGKVKTD
jgi:cytochrome b561